MKNLVLRAVFLGLGLLLLTNNLSAQQDTPDTNNPEHSLTHPTIVKIEYPTEKSIHRSHPAVSTESEKYVHGNDTNPVDIQRDMNNKGKLFIKGRGSLNHVRIFLENAPADEYPVMEHTFRGVNFEEINIAGLADGNYIIQYVSPHTATEIPLELRTVGTN